ncbi:L,D-transpeptidase family protein [Corallococcus sp. M34]|nr:L,D-transpeptidase family protein [Citreicoccus inhibens]
MGHDTAAAPSRGTAAAPSGTAGIAPSGTADLLSTWRRTDPQAESGRPRGEPPPVVDLASEPQGTHAGAEELSLSAGPHASGASRSEQEEALPGEDTPVVITEDDVPILPLGPDGEPLVDAEAPVDSEVPVLEPEPRVTSVGADAGVVVIAYAPDAGSLRVRRSIAVRSEPRQSSEPLGTVAQDMRVRWKGAMRGPDCEAWVEIEPQGWVCERYLEPNFREPRVRELPRVLDGELTPGIYARVVGHRVRAYPSLALARARRKGVLLKGSVTVKLSGQVKVGRRTFWRTTDGRYFEARALREYRPSDFSGLDADMLSELPNPFAWAQSRTTPRAAVEVRRAPDAHAPRATVLPPRTLVAVHELSADGRWVRIADGYWVARDDLHVAWYLPAPPQVEPGERWLDVDLDAQVLVAYEGERPVYATLVSSGAPGTDTPEGLYRIWVKFAEADMRGRTGMASYTVATVPWTMFFQGDFALHTAYWHDRFGEPVSHGCINLAPKDARALYAWTAPEVPLGWSMVHATHDVPGSWVRIRGQSRVVARPGRKVSVAVNTR